MQDYLNDSRHCILHVTVNRIFLTTNKKRRIFTNTYITVQRRKEEEPMQRKVVGYSST